MSAICLVNKPGACVPLLTPAEHISIQTQLTPEKQVYRSYNWDGCKYGRVPLHPLVPGYAVGLILWHSAQWQQARGALPLSQSKLTIPQTFTITVK